MIEPRYKQVSMASSKRLYQKARDRYKDCSEQQAGLLGDSEQYRALELQKALASGWMAAITELIGAGTCGEWHDEPSQARAVSSS